MVSSSVEQLQRFSRRSMVVLLAVVLAMGAIAVALVVAPEGEWQKKTSWLVPVAIAITAAGLRGTLRGQRWDPRSPEVRMVMEDEFRRVNMDRATRAAFVVALLAQWPLALGVAYGTALPPARIAFAIAAATTTIALATLICVFLFLDRE